jgi:hypothetical protein
VQSEDEQNVEELLTQDHLALDQLLQALITGIEASDAATTFARLDLFWARLAMHIRAEHLHLFPSILANIKTDPGVQENTVDEALNKLRGDHDFFMHELANAVNLMRESFAANHRLSTSETLANVCHIINDVAERLRLHNQMEEELVYRLPARLFMAVKQSELAQEVRHELENLPPRFGK